MTVQKRIEPAYVREYFLTIYSVPQLLKNPSKTFNLSGIQHQTTVEVSNLNNELYR